MISAQSMADMQAQGLWPAVAARVCGVSKASLYRAERRTGVVLPRAVSDCSVLRVDHREAVQDMKAADAVEYLLTVLEAIIAPVEADLAWGWPGVHLRPQQRRLIRALALTQGRPVSRETLYGALNGDRAGGIPEGKGKIVEVVLTPVRRVLAAQGVRVVNHRAEGWSVAVPPGFVWPWEAAHDRG